MYSTVQYSTAANVSLYLKVLYPAKNIYLTVTSFFLYLITP